MTRTAALIFFAALAIRLAVIAQLHDEPLFRTPQLDALEYVEWGEQLARGDFTWPVAPTHGPGYPLLIGLVLAAARSLLAVQVLQAILGSIGAVLTWSTARRFAGPVAGIAAGLLHAFYAPLILIDVSILAEGLFVFLLTLMLWLVARLSAGDFPRTTLPIVFAGLLLGFAIIVRPTAAVLVPLFGFFIVRATEKRALAAAIFLAATAWPVLPVLIQNRITSGSLAVQTSGGMNFHIGNTPSHDGTAWARPGGGWDLMRGAPWRAGIRNAGAEDRFYIRETLDQIAREPMGFAKVLASKLIWLTQDEEVRDSHSFHFFAVAAPLLAWLPRFGVALALAVCGIVVTRRLQAWRLHLGYVLLMSITVVALVAGFRYRMPVMPALFVFAGAGVAATIAAIVERRWRSVGALALIFASVIVLSNLREHSESHDFSEELAMSALALKNEGDVDDAARLANVAISVNPRSDMAWVTLGDIEATRGRWAEAETAWRRAVSIDANNARAWSHLAHAHHRRQELKETEAMLRRALSIKYEPEAAGNLAVLQSAR
ncbi:MAG TPA: tetratricopeptide repeat protein [Thermoanaerobaculia bacterium]|nr:tetratricopeptide repeat protein [Thermoanaerobaculia bacterium]